MTDFSSFSRCVPLRRELTIISSVDFVSLEGQTWSKDSELVLTEVGDVDVFLQGLEGD